MGFIQIGQETLNWPTVHYKTYILEFRDIETADKHWIVQVENNVGRVIKEEQIFYKTYVTKYLSELYELREELEE